MPAPGDALILKTFAGYQGGVPAHFHQELHTALSWLLYGLHTLAPALPWFSVMQLVLLWLGCAVIVKSLTRCAVNRGLHWGWGAAAGGVAVGRLRAVCMLPGGSRPDRRIAWGGRGRAGFFTRLYLGGRPAGSAGAAGVGRLLLAAYCLYPEGAFAALTLWALCVLTIRLTVYAHAEVASRGTLARRGARGLILSVWICAFCFLIFAAVRNIELDAMGEFAVWQGARAALFQSPAFPAGVSDAMLEAVGLVAPPGWSWWRTALCMTRELRRKACKSWQGCCAPARMRVLVAWRRGWTAGSGRLRSPIRKSFWQRQFRSRWACFAGSRTGCGERVGRGAGWPPRWRSQAAAYGFARLRSMAGFVFRRRWRRYFPPPPR